MVSKIHTPQSLEPLLEARRGQRHRVVFTNGCFDLLHVGHVRYLEAARREGDLLVVGVNTDGSVGALKGRGRPVIPQAQRCEVLASLESVDFVVLFDEPDPLNLIRALRPHVLVKGADWPEDRIVGADFVRGIGGRVVRVKVVPEVSTTAIIARILDRFGPGSPASGSRNPPAMVPVREGKETPP